MERRDDLHMFVRSNVHASFTEPAILNTRERLLMDTIRTMITFKQDNARFTYRVGGIVVHNEQILFQRSTLQPDNVYWFLPGGRAEIGESAKETLKREMSEELGESVEVGTLLYVVENFFVDTRESHELGLYFAMQLPANSHILAASGEIIREDEKNNPIIFDWLPLAQLAQLKVQPKFFSTALQDLPQHTIHVVINDPPH
jgi:ADP-ribose pyrophosphatase YjhB (NUDIX family)